MTDVEMHDHDLPRDASDYLIALLGALTFGGVAWAVGFGLVEGTRFGLEYFEIALPASGLVTVAISVAFVAFPVLLGLFSAWRSYVKLISLD